jgi:hypothetical protein
VNRAKHGNLVVPQKYVSRDEHRLGIWINNHRRRSHRLTPERKRLLDALGMIW